MAKIFTVQGANNPDELKRLAALEQLNELPTEVLGRLAELSQNEKAVGFFKTNFQYAILKGFLNKM